VFDCLGGNTPPERNTAWIKGRKCFHCLGAPNNLIRPCQQVHLIKHNLWQASISYTFRHPSAILRDSFRSEKYTTPSDTFHTSQASCERYPYSSQIWRQAFIYILHTEYKELRTCIWKGSLSRNVISQHCNFILIKRMYRRILIL